MNVDTSVKIFKALADPTRLDIVRTIAKSGGKSSCGQVSTCSDLSQPAMSHHFAKLVESGVLEDLKDGIHKYYTLNTALLERTGIDISKL